MSLVDNVSQPVPRSVRWAVGEDTQAVAGEPSFRSQRQEELPVGCVSMCLQACFLPWMALVDGGRPRQLCRSQMGGQQRALLDDAARISKASTASAQRALNSAEEARQVAVATLGELATQTDSLHRVYQSLQEADSHVAVAETTLDSMNSRCLGCFGPKRKLSNRRPAAPLQDFRGTGNKVYSAKQRLASTAYNVPRMPAASSTLFADDKLASEAAQQDAVLQQLDQAVTELHAVALHINDEVQSQQPALDALSERAQGLHERLSEANTQGKMAHVERPAKRGWFRRWRAR